MISDCRLLKDGDDDNDNENDEPEHPRQRSGCCNGDPVILPFSIPIRVIIEASSWLVEVTYVSIGDEPQVLARSKEKNFSFARNEISPRVMDGMVD